jgi:HK97 family phage major capsid protein
MSTEHFRRALELGARAADTAGDLVVDMAFSSEAPYERWWGVEILDHSESSIRLDRLKDGAPVLFNHNWNDLRGTHVAESIHIGDDRVLRGQIRITAATNAGREAIALVNGRILTKASIGYEIHKVIEQTTKKNAAGELEPVSRELDGRLFERIATRAHQDAPGDLAAFRRALDAAAGPFERATDTPTTYRVVDWAPHENSLVTIPADNSVGLGRSVTPNFEPGPAPSTEETAPHRAKTTPANTAKQGHQMPDLQTPAAAPIAEQPDTRTALQLEQARKKAIENLCQANGLPANQAARWITTGASLEQVADEILEVHHERGKNNPAAVADIGMTKREIERYSLFRMISAVSSGDYSKAGFELECHKAVRGQLGRDPQQGKAFFVPAELLKSPLARDLTAGTGSAGGYLVQTENVSFIELLRNRSVCLAMGMTRLSGLVGNVTIPKQSGAATANWITDEAGTGASESNLTFGQLALTPKTVVAYTEISRQLQLQSAPAAEGLVMADLAAQTALAVDAAALQGSGASGQPTGIITTGGIGGFSGTTIGLAGIIEAQTDAATANALFPSSGYVATPAVAGLLMQRQRFTSTDTPIWVGNVLDGTVLGYRAMSSNQMPASRLLFGDFSKAVLGEWGVLEIGVNEVANFIAGIIGIRAMYSVDVGVRYPGAFSYSTAIT